MAGLTALVKGHGAGNDFLLAADPTGTLDPDPVTVAAWCDRRHGIGADGLLLAVPASTAGIPTAAEWFMDHRAADGSVGEPCGHGLGVFVAFLRHTGLADLSDGASVLVATRAGDRRVWVNGEEYTAEIGDFAIPGGLDAATRGFDVAVKLPGLERRPGLRVDVGSPHVVVALDSPATLAALTLTGARYDPDPPAGTSLDVVVPLGALPDGRGSLRLRAHGPDGGEDRTCATACGAAAVAVREWAGAGAPDEWVIEAPGGTFGVRIDGRRVLVTGPAVLVAELSPLA